jgi:hypothetical protein
MRRLSRELEESAYSVELRVERRIVQADKLQPLRDAINWRPPSSHPHQEIKGGMKSEGRMLKWAGNFFLLHSSFIIPTLFTLSISSFLPHLLHSSSAQVSPQSAFPIFCVKQVKQKAGCFTQNHLCIFCFR